MSRASRMLGHLVTLALLVPVAFCVLLPFVWLVSSSLKTPEDFFSSIFLPAGEGFLGVAWNKLTFANFITLFTEVKLGIALANSLLYASLASLLATLACAGGGYSLAMYRFRGRAVALWLVIAALVIPPPLILAPGYQWLFELGLLDTRAGVVLPLAAPAFGVFLFRQATRQAVPRELLEAARLDGCSELGMFFGIALPLLRPMASAFILITFVAIWNNFIWPQVVLQSADQFPLSVAIAQMRDVYSTDYGMLMAGTLVSILPVMLLFLCLQKEFVSGLTLGAVKG